MYARILTICLGICFCVVNVPTGIAVEIVSDDFEGDGGGCEISSDWDPDTSATTSTVRSVSGQCAAYGDYTAVEDSHYLYERNFPPEAEGTKTFHVVYRVYFKGPNPPNHQKMNRFFLQRPGASGKERGAQYAHYYLGAKSAPEDINDGRWRISTESYTIDEPPIECREINTGSVPIGEWVKVEIYVELNGTCTTDDQCGAPCSDVARVWIDDELLWSTDTGNFAGSHNMQLFKFWIMGNASDAIGDNTVDWEIWVDDVCVGTSADDCTQPPFLGTKAAEEFGDPSTECNDGIDNDGDGDVDLQDTGCSTASGDDETNCGDGVAEGPEACDGDDLAGESCASRGFDAGTLSCNATCDGFDTSGCSGVSHGSECDDWRQRHPEWIWCDDFEEQSELSERYFDVNKAGGRLGTTEADAFAGVRSLRAEYAQGAASAGYIWKAFGRSPVTETSGDKRHDEVYWRFFVKMQPDWSGQPDKLTRATMFTASDWSQGMIAHLWGDDALGTAIDPVSCVDGDTVVCEGYNDFENMIWLGKRNGVDQIYRTAAAGIWRCVEVHVELNDPGVENGIFEWWIDGELQNRSTNLDWRGSYDDHGINAINLENYWNGGAPLSQERFFDNWVISTAPIGCDVGGGDPNDPPSTVERLRRTDIQ